MAASLIVRHRTTDGGANAVRGAMAFLVRGPAASSDLTIDPAEWNKLGFPEHLRKRSGCEGVKRAWGSIVLPANSPISVVSLVCVCATVAVSTWPLNAHAQVIANKRQAPEVTPERHTEDWSHLDDPSKRTGHWTEKFKYIPLSSDGLSYLTMGLEARVRYEGFRNPNWGSRPDDSYVWHRFMPYADLHFSNVRMFIQPVFSAISGTDRPLSPVDTSGTDALQAFLEVDLQVAEDASLSVSAGRKVFSLGAGRFIDSRYGPNILQPFDGADVAFSAEGRQLRMLYFRPVNTRAGDMNDRSSTTQAVWGVYATQWLDRSRVNGVDVYYLGFRDSDARVDQGAGHLIAHTIGSRLFGKRGNWSWNVEGAVQRGSFADKQVQAFGVGSEVSYRLSSSTLKPMLAFTLDYASGDRDLADDKLGTMNPLFPRGQYFVTQSPVGPRNLIHVRSSLTVYPEERLAISINGGGYWRASTRDGIYNMPGFLERSGAGSRARFVSKQYELAVDWQANSELSFRGLVSLFDPQRFIRETGTARSIRAVVATTSFRF